VTDWALLLLRLWLGSLFTAHALQKLLGWWGGPGWAEWTSRVTRHGFRPSALFAALALGAELAGGPLLLVGLATPVAAAFLSVLMIVAIRKVHFRNGFFNERRGFEFQGTLLVGLVTLGIAGPGRLALDAALPATLLDGQAYAALVAGGVLLTLPGMLRPSAVPPAPAASSPATSR